MKNAAFFCAISFHLITVLHAQQFKTVQVGIDGLTCSMCTRATELSIRKLDFVDSVQMDLTNTNGIVTFKKGADVSVEKIAKAVRDAGFSVRYLKADLQFDSGTLASGSCFSYKNDSYKYIGPDKPLPALLNMTFIGKEFMPKKDLKKWSGKINEPCSTDKKTFYVTI